MKLKKWPSTEERYWEIIEYLGCWLWNTRHDLSHGRIQNSLKLENDLIEVKEIQEQLVSELFVNFGVIPPTDCPDRNDDGEMPSPPPGMKWYWTWYNEMKRKLYKADYDKIICSACPLSEGLDQMIASDRVPCSVYPGMLYRLLPAYECAMIKHGVKQWTQEYLFCEIRKSAGEKGVLTFLMKQNELLRAQHVAR